MPPRGQGRRPLRRQARESALQALYQWEVGGGDLDEIVATSWALQARSIDPDRDRFASRLVRGVAGDLARIDPLIASHTTHWRPERLAVVDRLILRLAVHELLHDAATPPAVVINEAIELARTFSSVEAAGFINGVLDAIRRDLEADGALAAAPGSSSSADTES